LPAEELTGNPYDPRKIANLRDAIEGRVIERCQALLGQFNPVLRVSDPLLEYGPLPASFFERRGRTPTFRGIRGTVCCQF
jgi:hypothetical protein